MAETIPITEGSEAVVGRGLPEDLLPPRASRESAAVIFQPSVADVAIEVAARCTGARVVSIEAPDREAVKDMAAIVRLYERLLTEGIGRHDTVVGVGGGAVTDAAGFVAATWHRGLESVMVPTTLLAAVDASIGGKTGINLRAVPFGAPTAYAKNLIGAYWHPRRVVIDLDRLDLLPPALRAEGTAEILKAGLIGDPGIVEIYSRDGTEAALDRLVPRAVRVKAGIVAADFREEGRRAVLNYGHTIGHAVEGVTGMPHGHAVAVGMIAEAVVSSARFGFDHRWLADLVFSLGLPVAAAGISKTGCMGLVAKDKKRDAGGIRMVLLQAVGRPEVVTVTEDEVDLALTAIGAV